MRAMLSRLGPLATCLVLGIAVGTVGTVMHRSIAPWGLVLGLFVVVSAATFARAWQGATGTGVVAGGWFVTVLALWQRGPGGDLLVPDLGPWGTVWILGGALLAAAPLLAPARWFVD